MMSSDKPLEGRVALITGASRGIGAAVAKAYAKAGAHVVLLARTQQDLEKIDDEIRSQGGTATLVPFDLRKLEELEALGPMLDQKFGRLDIFVANAGILGTLTPVAHSKMKEWADALTVNVTANVQLIRTLDPLLRASDAGRAIFVTTDTDPSPFWGVYGVSKMAARQMALTYAAETVQTNLRVNLIHPGAVATQLLHQAFPGGYQGDDLLKPEEITPLFIELAHPSCTRHGEIVTPDELSRLRAAS